MKPTMTPTKNSIGLTILLLLAVVWTPHLHGQSYTITPTPFQTAFNNSGTIISNACVWTYQAGTSTLATTYADNAGTANANPIRTDSAGRFTAYLVAGSNYKFVYESSCTPPAHGTVLRTADNIAATPASAASVDVTGTAGESITAGQCVYLSDGSGSKTAGQWFKCDSTNTYSSTLAEVGMAPSAIASAASGTIRLMGSVTGLSSLSVGSEYFVSTSGAITITAPGNKRHLGHADSATTFVLTGNPPPIASTIVDDLRLSLTTATCVTTADVTGASATTIFLTPCLGNRITLSDASGNLTTYTTAEISIAVPATTSTMYDVFVFANSGVPTLELLAWTNDTTRATAIARTTTAFYTKSGDLTRRYLGSCRTTTVSGQTEDSLTKRYLWNYYNRVPRLLQRIESTVSWTYTTATLRQANASTANQVDVVIGVAETALQLTLIAHGSNTGSTIAYVAIGQDSTTTAIANLAGGNVPFSVANVIYETVAIATLSPAVGRHFYAWLEESVASGTTTWYGTTTATGMPVVSGLFGRIEG